MNDFLFHKVDKFIREPITSLEDGNLFCSDREWEVEVRDALACEELHFSIEMLFHFFVVHLFEIEALSNFLVVHLFELEVLSHFDIVVGCDIEALSSFRIVRR